jgi:putative membrane protein
MPTSNELAEDRTDLAQDRTDWAEDRTILANERTFAGWMRTGLASAGVGLGFQAIFGKFEPTWLAKTGATIFILIGVVIFYMAYRKACELQERMDSHAAEPMSHSNFRLISMLFIAGSLMLNLILWFL